MKKQLIFILTLVFLASCNLFDTQEIEASHFGTNFVRAEKIMFVEEDYCTTDKITNIQMCAEVKVSFLEALGGSFAQNFNKVTQNLVLTVLDEVNGVEKNEPIVSSYASEMEKRMHQFLTNYREYVNDVRKKNIDTKTDELATLAHKFDYHDSIVYADSKVLSLLSSHYAYLGSAHGYGYTSYLNFRPNGSLITNDELITNKIALKQVAEKHFRKALHIQPDEDLVENLGFFFGEEGFALPEAIGIVKDSLLFYYNSYEAGPYAYGNLEFYVPFSEIKDYISLK